jgi:hypothetical protein
MEHVAQKAQRGLLGCGSSIRISALINLAISFLEVAIFFCPSILRNA